MNAVMELEKIGYTLGLAIDYTAPDKIPLDANDLLLELAANKSEAVLYLAERGIQPLCRMTSEQYRSTITKGIQAGHNPFELLIQAMECISSMTSDSVFYMQNYEDIKAIYGAGLLEPVPLEMELAEVRERLKMLTRPELETEPEDSKRRIQTAIKAHRERETHLLKLMEGKK